MPRDLSTWRSLPTLKLREVAQLASIDEATESRPDRNQRRHQPD